MQLEALAGLEEGARHPAGREAEQAAGGRDLGINKFGNVLLDRLQGSERVHGAGKGKKYEGFEDDESESRRDHVAAHRLSFASDPILRRE